MAGTDDYSGSGSLDPAQIQYMLDNIKWEWESANKLPLEDSRRLIYELAYIELCEEVTGKKPSKQPPDEKWFAYETLKYFYSKRRNEVKQKICIELEYCKYRKKLGSYASVADLLSLASSLFTDLATTLGVATFCWASSRQILDKLCECDEQPKLPGK